MRVSPVRFAIRISPMWRPLFAAFGFRQESASVELEDDALHIRFGGSFERIPLADVAGVAPRRWPFYYGLGPKLGPDKGVSWVGSTDGVVKIDFVAPRPIVVWGPFRSSAAQCLIVSLEDRDAFIAAVDAARSRRRDRDLV